MATYPYYSPYTQQYYQYPQMMTQQNQPTSIIWVQGEREAAAYPVAPNNAVALWDSDAPVIYLKQADAAGKPSMKAFDLVERAEQSKKEPDNYDSIMKSISEMRSDIDSLKNDVYGLAGKKRKKVEEDE